MGTALLYLSLPYGNRKLPKMTQHYYSTRLRLDRENLRWSSHDSAFMGYIFWAATFASFSDLGYSRLWLAVMAFPQLSYSQVRTPFRSVRLWTDHCFSSLAQSIFSARLGTGCSDLFEYMPLGSNRSQLPPGCSSVDLAPSCAFYHRCSINVLFLCLTRFVEHLLKAWRAPLHSHGQTLRMKLLSIAAGFDWQRIIATCFYSTNLLSLSGAERLSLIDEPWWAWAD